MSTIYPALPYSTHILAAFDMQFLHSSCVGCIMQVEGSGDAHRHHATCLVPLVPAEPLDQSVALAFIFTEQRVVGSTT